MVIKNCTRNQRFLRSFNFRKRLNRRNFFNVPHLNVRIIQYGTCSFNPLFLSLVATTNGDAAASIYKMQGQATLDIEELRF